MNRQMLPCFRILFRHDMQRHHTYTFCSCASVHMLQTLLPSSLTGTDPTQPHRKGQAVMSLSALVLHLWCQHLLRPHPSIPSLKLLRPHLNFEKGRAVNTVCVAMHGMTAKTVADSAGGPADPGEGVD